MLPPKETLNKNIRVRLASNSDLEAISDLYKKEMSFHEQFDPLFALSKEFNGVIYFSRFIENPENLILVAEETGKIIGYIHIRILKEKAQKNKSKWAKFKKEWLGGKKTSPRFNIRWGYVADCFVESKYRQQGIGSLLLDKSIDWLRSRDVPFLDLEVHSLNESGINFWQANEFETFKLMMRKKL